VYVGDEEFAEPVQSLFGHDAHLNGFAEWSQYRSTTHFNGQGSISVSGATAHGETYCLAHHLSEKDDKRMMTVMAIRYLDQFVKEREVWLFKQRKLIIDWTDTRPSVPQCLARGSFGAGGRRGRLAN
jgi:hypothetical protein